MNGFYDPKLPMLLVKNKNVQLRRHDKKLHIKLSNIKELMRFSFNKDMEPATQWNIQKI